MSSPFFFFFFIAIFALVRYILFFALSLFRYILAHFFSPYLGTLSISSLTIFFLFYSFAFSLSRYLRSRFFFLLFLVISPLSITLHTFFLTCFLCFFSLSLRPLFLYILFSSLACFFFQAIFVPYIVLLFLSYLIAMINFFFSQVLSLVNFILNLY